MISMMVKETAGLSAGKHFQEGFAELQFSKLAAKTHWPAAAEQLVHYDEVEGPAVSHFTLTA
jgi:hypothetical protein